MARTGRKTDVAGRMADAERAADSLIETLEGSVRRELPGLAHEEASEVARAIGRLVEMLHPEQIYVFGSYARRSAESQSDVDLAVIVASADEPGHRRDQAAYEAIGCHRVPLEVLVLTREEFEGWRAVAGTLAATVAREGRVLYAAAGT